MPELHSPAPMRRPSPPAQWRGLLRSAASFAIGVVATLTLLHQLPDLSSPWVRHRTAVLQQMADNLTPGDTPTYLVFFGASMTRVNLDPLMFDSACSEAGLRNTWSLNFGMRGARLLATSYYIEDTLAAIRAQGLPMPQYAFIDLTFPPSTAIQPGAVIGFADWHDARRAWMSLGMIRDHHQPPEPFPFPFWIGQLSAFYFDQFSSRVFPLLLETLLHYLPWGRGKGKGKVVEPLYYLLSHEVYARSCIDPEDQIRGYASYDEQSDPLDSLRHFRRRHDQYLARLSEKRVEMERGKSQSRNPYYLLQAENYSTDAVRRIQAVLRDSGIEPVFFVPPTERPTHFAYKWLEDGVIPNLYAFDDPGNARYYAPDRRHDAGHLNNAGTVDFSRDFGRMFARQVLAGSGSGRGKLEPAASE